MSKELSFNVQVISVYGTGGGEGTAKFGCSSEDLSTAEKFVDKEKLLKFIIEGAEEEPLFGYIANVHSSYSGKYPRYFSVKFDASEKMKVGQLLTLTGLEINLKVFVTDEDIK